MKLLNEYTLLIKKSKFIGLFYEVDNIEEIDQIIKKIKIKYKNATHFPYCYKINNVVKKSDDKEPVNTAGTQIYKIIETYNLNNVLIVIVRYFGGIKLGIGTLLRSYLKTAKETIKEVIK